MSENKEIGIAIILSTIIISLALILSHSFIKPTIVANGVLNSNITEPLQNNSIIPIAVYDGYGNPINSLNNALNIHDADVHTNLFNHYFIQHTNNDSRLNGSALKNSINVSLLDASNFDVGNYIDLNQNETHIHNYKKIIAKNGNILTLDSPLDLTYENNSLMEEVIFNMAVAGSINSPKIFIVPTAENDIIHITSFLIAIVHSTSADDSKFGDLSALTNGVHIRVNRNNGSENYETLVNWKANKDMNEDMYEVTYTDKAGGGTLRNEREIYIK